MSLIRSGRQNKDQWSTWTELLKIRRWKHSWTLTLRRQVGPKQLESEACSTITWYKSRCHKYEIQESLLICNRALLKQLLLEGTNIEPIAYSISQNVRAGRASALPPTYIITGNNDTKVPHKQSLDVVAAYKSIGSNIEYHELDGLNHGFDNNDQEEMESMYQFIKNIL